MFSGQNFFEEDHFRESVFDGVLDHSTDPTSALTIAIAVSDQRLYSFRRHAKGDLLSIETRQNFFELEMDDLPDRDGVQEVEEDERVEAV